MKIRYLQWTVRPDQEGHTVKSLLRQADLSGTVLRRIKWLEDGILLDGARVTVRATVRAGQTLSVRLGDTEVKSDILPVPGPLNIVYEDEDLLVLDKAPGVPVHPGPGHYNDTIGNFLLWYYKKEEILADFHPVHRLDKGTSGLLVVAKHAHAQDQLRQQLHTDAFRRTYLAVCEGVPQPPSGTIDAPMARRPDSLIQQEVRPDGLPARTHYQVLSTAENRALLRLTLETGRTHQIRVHMAHIGHPLTGDFLYGTEVPELISRPALHSFSLSFRHPITGQLFSFTSPMPVDMKALCPPPSPL